MILSECWAEEGGIYIEIHDAPKDQCIIKIYDTTGNPKWPGELKAEATIARFRRDRIAEAIKPSLEKP